MDQRRLDLRLTWQDVAERGGVSLRALANARTGDSQIRPLTQAGIETGLQWEDGAVGIILAGGDPVPRPASPPGFLSKEMEAQAQPYADAIWRKLRDLDPGHAPRPGEDMPDPGGARLFGAGSPDAEEWDHYGSRGIPVLQRAWVLAALQVYEAAARDREASTG
jgi:hypothetical protein